MRVATNLLVAVAFALSGCASSITAWKNRPVAAHTLRPDRFFTLTGERRLAFQVKRATARELAWCAESLPEAAQSVTSSSKNAAKLSEKANLSSEDSFGTTLTQTFVRTEVAEVYRQMAWQACQAWAQGVYNDEQYRAQLDSLLNVGADVIRARAAQPLTTTPAKGEASAVAPTTSTKPDAATCKAKPATAGCAATGT